MGIRIDTTRRELVAAGIIAGIRQGKFQPGERLPLNIDLAEEFQVSEGTVSNAISDVIVAGYASKNKLVITATPEIDRPIVDELMEARAALVQASDVQREAQKLMDAARTDYRTALKRIDAAISALQSEE